MSRTSWIGLVYRDGVQQSSLSVSRPGRRTTRNLRLWQAARKACGSFSAPTLYLLHSSASRVNGKPDLLVHAACLSLSPSLSLFPPLSLLSHLSSACHASLLSRYYYDQVLQDQVAAPLTLSSLGEWLNGPGALEPLHYTRVLSRGSMNPSMAVEELQGFDVSMMAANMNRFLLSEKSRFSSLKRSLALLSRWTNLWCWRH